MHKYILRRILLLVPVLLGVTFVVFAIMALTPGDPGTLILGQNASEEAIRQINDQLGYNDPLLVKYFRYVLNAVRGDFGSSYRSQKPVFQEIFLRFPTTLKLAIGATILAVLIGIPIGIISAVKQCDRDLPGLRAPVLAWPDDDSVLCAQDGDIAGDRR